MAGQSAPAPRAPTSASLLPPVICLLPGAVLRRLLFPMGRFVCVLTAC